MQRALKTKAAGQDLEPRRREAERSDTKRGPEETAPELVLDGFLAAAPGDASRGGAARILRSPVLSRPSAAGLRAMTARRAQRHYGNRRVQRLLHEGGEERDGGSTPTVAAEEVIPASSPGLPLDDETRGFMESRFQRDFGDVRVHTDAAAAESAEALSAEAYATGRDIYFARGRYAPQTREGRRLLSHELTHTVQQAGTAGSLAPAAKGSGTVVVGRADDPLEREAEQFAELVTSTAVSGREGRRLSAHEQDPTVRQSGWRSSTVVWRQPAGGAAHAATAPTVTTMGDFIDLVRRIETANPGRSAMEIARLIFRTKYHSAAWEWLLPSTAGTPQVSAGRGVTGGDVATLSRKLVVSLPGGGTADALHVISALVAHAETRAPGSGGAGGRVAGLLVRPLPARVSQRGAASWVGDVGQAAAEWMTVHPHPRGGSTKQHYMDEYAPEFDLLADVDGVAMTSTTGASGFAFNPAQPLSQNLERFFLPTAPRQARFRRFHIFCAVEGLTLQPDGVTLSSSATSTIDDRIHDFADWFTKNNPSILTWMAVNGPSPGMPTFNPIWQEWTRRASDWRWFARKFRDFVQQNLQAEGP